MLETLLQKWAGLPPRDRRMLMIAGLFLLVIVIWLVLFEPAWQGTKRLEKSLPGLRADLARMDQLADEARELSRVTSAPPENSAQLKVRLEQSLLAQGINREMATVEAHSDILEVRFRQAPFEAWVFWLDGAVRETRTRGVDLSITRESAGVFSGRVALEVPRRGS